MKEESRVASIICDIVAGLLCSPIILDVQITSAKTNYLELLYFAVNLNVYTQAKSRMNRYEKQKLSAKCTKICKLYPKLKWRFRKTKFNQLNCQFAIHYQFILTPDSQVR